MFPQQLLCIPWGKHQYLVSEVHSVRKNLMRFTSRPTGNNFNERTTMKSARYPLVMKRRQRLRHDQLRQLAEGRTYSEVPS